MGYVGTDNQKQVGLNITLHTPATQKNKQKTALANTEIKSWFATPFTASGQETEEGLF